MTNHTGKFSNSQTALLYSEKYGVDKVRVLTLAKNRGKGGAVRMVGSMMCLCAYKGKMKWYKKIIVNVEIEQLYLREFATILQEIFYSANPLLE